MSFSICCTYIVHSRAQDVVIHHVRAVEEVFSQAGILLFAAIQS